ncbi:hypothetical protein KUCAC02_032003 [Chaenocephalus aceratus]|nr:hypothetical protein KUCAC02_032003 [Chaenocephalus aceratus]
MWSFQDTHTHIHTHTHTHTPPVTYGLLLPHLIVYKMASGYCELFVFFKANLENTTKQCVVPVIEGSHVFVMPYMFNSLYPATKHPFCYSPTQDPQTSTHPLPLLPEDPANIALFVDVSPSADLLNVLPHVDASAYPPPEFPHPFSMAAPTLKVPLRTALTGVPVCVMFQFYTPEPEPEPRGDSK